jgi:hypothetical protein
MTKKEKKKAAEMEGRSARVEMAAVGVDARRVPAERQKTSQSRQTQMVFELQGDAPLEVRRAGRVFSWRLTSERANDEKLGIVNFVRPQQSNRTVDDVSPVGTMLGRWNTVLSDVSPVEESLPAATFRMNALERIQGHVR